MRGIYKIYCDQEDYVYIGSSINIEKRWFGHRANLRANAHHCEALQLAWNAYGEDSFTFEILEETNAIVQAEQHWLDKFWPKCYNTSPKAWNCMRNPDIVKKVGEALRNNDNKNRQILTEEHVREIKIALRDKTHTQTELAKLFEVSTSTIFAIVEGRNWAYVQVEGFTEGRKPKTTDFLPEIVELKQAGLTHNQIIEALGLSCRSNGITYALKRAKKLGIA